MNYKTTKDKYIPNKKYVWCNSFCVGYYTIKIFEKKDIDWQKYREDKTLRMTPGERWYTKYYPYAFPNEKCDISSSEEEAVKQILKKHKYHHDNLFKQE